MQQHSRAGAPTFLVSMRVSAHGHAGEHMSAPACQLAGERMSAFACQHLHVSFQVSAFTCQHLRVSIWVSAFRCQHLRVSTSTQQVRQGAQ